jgi:GT2 family glycosyltransferase
MSDASALGEAIPVAWVMGAFLMLRRSVLDEVGLLDEDYFMYAEETDLCKRIQRAGYAVFYVPDKECVHIGGASWEDIQRTETVSPARIDAMLRSQVFYIRKHHGSFASAVYALGSLITALNRLIYLKLTGWARRKTGEEKSQQHLLRNQALLRASTASLFRPTQPGAGTSGE